jgi:hypothetical protein
MALTQLMDLAKPSTMRDELLALLSEREWQNLVVRYALARGWWCYHTFDSRRSQPGFADLTMVRAPRLAFAELKRAGGRASPSQTQFIERVAEVPGVEAYLWYPDHWRKIAETLF